MGAPYSAAHTGHEGDPPVLSPLQSSALVPSGLHCWAGRLVGLERARKVILGVPFLEGYVSSQHWSAKTLSKQGWAQLTLRGFANCPPTTSSLLQGAAVTNRHQSREDPLEKGVATHSSILAREIPWIEEPGRLQSTESKRVRHD